MEKEKNQTKEKILETVLEILKTKSGHLLTMREIAKKAEVSLASINYHFGSKENLIIKASQFYWKQWEDILTELENSKEYPAERLKEYLYSYVNFILKYEGIFKNYIMKVISKMDYDLIAEENIRKQSDIIKETIKDCTKIEDEQVLSFKTITILSSVVYPALLGSYGVKSLELDIYNNEVKRKYISGLVDSILNILD
jgi:AcrR family transcriptional regulator